MSLGSNIRTLRILFSETLEDLQFAIDVESKSTISQYENNVREPKDEILVKIAKHYNVTTDELKYGSFDIANPLKLPLDDKNKLKDYFDVLLPIANSKEAENNDNYSKAYSIHMAFYDCVVLEKNIENDSEFDEMIELYSQASDEGISEGCINILWFVLISIYIRKNQKLFEEISRYKKKKSSEKEVIHSYLYDVYDEEDNENYEDEEELIYECIRNSKKNIRTIELADYYNALIYLLDIIKTNDIAGFTKTIGGEMMFNLARLGNKYARDFILVGFKENAIAKDA